MQATRQLQVDRREWALAVETPDVLEDRFEANAMLIREVHGQHLYARQQNGHDDDLSELPLLYLNANC